MDTFEYKTVKAKTAQSLFKAPGFDTNEIDTILNDLGREGWELVSTSNLTKDGWSRFLILFFKRKRNNITS